MTLRYTHPWISSTILARIDADSNKASTLEDQKEMNRKVAFPYPSADPVGTPITHRLGTASVGLYWEAVQRTLYDQK